MTLADELTHLSVAEEDTKLRAVMRDRLAEYKAEPCAAIPWEELMAGLLTKKSDA